MAAKPNEPPMPTLRKWIAALEQATGKTIAPPSRKS